MIKLISLLCFFFGYSSQCLGAQSDFEYLNKLNHFALVRHSDAPGVGDPAGFQLGDCKTQRNLSEKGKKNAQTLGLKIKAALKKQGLVYTSQWCRCRDTASYFDISTPVDLNLLNSFFATPQKEDKQTSDLKKWLTQELKKEKPLVLVTHQVNITALTGVYPDSGEVIICKLNSNGEIEVVHRYK